MRINNISPAFTGAYAFQMSNANHAFILSGCISETVKKLGLDSEQYKAAINTDDNSFELDTPGKQWRKKDKTLLLAAVGSDTATEHISLRERKLLVHNIEKAFAEKPRARSFIPHLYGADYVYPKGKA